MPILARHAVSLSVAFVFGLVLSYFAGQYIHQQFQLGKLNSADQATFDRGVGYVLKNAGTSETVTADALKAVQTIDTQRAADLLLAVAQSHAARTDIDDPPIPAGVNDAVASLMKRLGSLQAIGLYDGLIQVAGIDAIGVSEDLLNSLQPKDDAELLQVVALLDTRLLWSRRWAPLDLWVRWLGVLAQSESELTQFNTAKRLGELHEAADDPRVVSALGKLAQSKFDTIRNTALNVVAGYAAIAKDPTDYEQIIFTLGKDANKTIARRSWMIVGHLNPRSGFAVNWRDADPSLAEAMLWSAVKTNPENDKPALNALKTEGYEAAGAMALNEWRRPQIPVSDADLLFQKLIEDVTEQDMLSAWRSILASKDYMNAEASVIRDYGYMPIQNDKFLPLYLAGSWVRAGDAPEYESAEPYSEALLAAFLEGLYDHGGNDPGIRQNLVSEQSWPPFVRLLAACHGTKGGDLDQLVSEIPLREPVLLDLFTLALTHADNETIDRFIRSSHPEMVTMAALASVMKGYQPQLIDGVYAALQKNPNLDIEALRTMSDEELASLGLTRIDALPVLAEAAEAAPPSANRATEAKLLKLAMWIRGDLGEDFTPTAEAMLFDDEVPTSTVLMCLLHMKRPAALDYLFGDLATSRPDLHQLFIQKRYWHVFRRFVNTSDLTLWLWGDPDAQAFQLEAMKLWYAVNRWKIDGGWWPEPSVNN